MTTPAKGPVFSYLGIDLVLFTYFFTSDLIYLMGGRSALGGEGFLILPFIIGLCY